jgi:hypothetical protein
MQTYVTWKGFMGDAKAITRVVNADTVYDLEGFMRDVNAGAMCMLCMWPERVP